MGCEKYSADTQHIIDGVENGFVVFNHQGKQGHEVGREIKQQDVAWLMQRLGKLSDAQINAALKASGATPEEVSCFSPAFRSRLSQLTAVATATPSSEGSTTRTITTTTDTTTVPKTQ